MSEDKSMPSREAEYESLLYDRNMLLAEFQRVRAELQAAREDSVKTIQSWEESHLKLSEQLATTQAEIERLGSLRGNVLLQRDVERLEREIERLKASPEQRSPAET